jgi:IS5 family transposase
MKYTKKNNQNYFGGKVHQSQDQKTKLIKKLRFTPANVSDSKVFEQLLDKDERAVFADKGIRKNSEQFHLLAFLSNCYTINQKKLVPILTG